MDLLNEYISNLYISDELNNLNEFEIEKIMKKLMPKSRGISLTNELISAANNKDPKSILTIANKLGIKKVKQNTIDEIGSKSVDNYQEKKELAIKVLKNSLRAKPKIIEAAAATLAFASMIKRRGETIDDNRRLKLLLKDVVEKARSFYDEEETEDQKTRQAISSDWVVAWATITVTTALLGSVLVLIYLFWPFVLGIFLGIILLVTFLVIGKIVGPK
jgi:membrane-associated protease RseP (regulator of RpoE activity)